MMDELRAWLLLGMGEEKGFIVDTKESTGSSVWGSPEWTWPAE